MDKQPKQKPMGKFFTIPNMLSCLRILLIPVLAYLYSCERYIACIVVWIISCLSDAMDGWIARRFNMISDWGKILDPIADKTTQGVLAICLAKRYPMLWWLLILLLIKEAVTVVPRLLIIRKTGVILPAVWHGKVTTTLLDAVILVHVFWAGIPEALSTVLITACMVMMTLSMVLYGVENIRTLRSSRKLAA